MVFSDSRRAVSSLLRLPTIWDVYWLRASFNVADVEKYDANPDWGVPWTYAATASFETSLRSTFTAARAWTRLAAIVCSAVCAFWRFCWAVLYLSSRMDVCCSSWDNVASIWLTCDLVVLICDWF